MASRPASHVGTAYIRRYRVDIGGKKYNDQYVLFHPNGLVVVGLAPTHELFHLPPSGEDADECIRIIASGARGGGGPDGGEREPIVLTSVDYELGGSRKIQCMPTGKRKKGGACFRADDVVCRIQAAKLNADNTQAVFEYEPVAVVQGKVLEMNDSLLETPSPLLTHCGSNGYLCVLLPFDDKYEEAKAELMTPEEYARLRGEELKGYEGEEMMTGGMKERKRGPAFLPRIPDGAMVDSDVLVT